MKASVIGLMLLAGLNMAHAGSSPEVWLVEATTAEKNNDYKKAMQLYIQAEQVKEMQDQAIIGIARVLIHDNEMEKAKAVLEEFLSVKNPFNPDARLMLVEVLHTIGKYDEALASMKIVDELRSGWHPAKYRRGLVYLDQRNYNSAIDQFSFLLKEDPLHFDARVHRAKAYLAKDQADAALTDGKVALEQRPHSIDARVLIGTAQFAKADYRGADETLRVALQSNPNVIEINERLGDVQVKLNKNVAAVDFYKHCIELDSHRLDVGLKLSKLYVKMGKYKDAQDELKRELALFPGYDPAQFQLVAIYLEEKRADLAATSLAGYTDRFPHKLWSAVAYEKLLLSISEWDRAEDFAVRNMKASGYAVEPYLYHAFVRAKRGDLRGALKIVQDAEQLYPSDPRVKFNKALLNESLGETKEAMAFYKEVQDNVTLTYKARINLAILLEKSGKTEEAADVLRNTVEPRENRKIAADDTVTGNSVHPGSSNLKPFREMELP